MTPHKGIFLGLDRSYGNLAQTNACSNDYRLFQLTIHKTTDMIRDIHQSSCLYRSMAPESGARHASVKRTVTARHGRPATWQAFQRLIQASRNWYLCVRLLVISTERLLTRHLHPICQPQALLFRHLRLGRLRPPP